MEANVLKVPRSIPNTNDSPQAFVVGAKDESVALSISLFLEVENTPEQFLNQPTPSADRVWRKVEDIVGVAGEVVVSTIPPYPGNYYVQITAGAAAGAELLVGVV